MFGPVRVEFLCVGGIEILLELFIHKMLILGLDLKGLIYCEFEILRILFMRCDAL